MKEMHKILKFTNQESSTFEKVFCVRPTNFSLLGVKFTLLKFFRFQNSFQGLILIKYNFEERKLKNKGILSPTDFK